MVEFSKWLRDQILPRVGATWIRFLGNTIRIRTEGADLVDDLYRQGRHVILAFWHSRQLMIPVGYRGTKAHILISQHRDGELIQRIVARFGHEAVRGSTTRGGTAALRRLIRLGRAGADLVVTPDGPRGPRQIVQPGVIHLARATGMPIVPLTFSCSKKNSSRVGIGSWFPIRGGAGSLYGARPSGCRIRPRPRTSRPNASNWRRP